MHFLELSAAKSRSSNGLPAGDHCVYAIVGPDLTIRYVGHYAKDVKRRLREHLRTPVSRFMGAWLSSLRRSGKRATIHVLQLVRDEDASTAERDWIHWITERASLLNIHRGQLPRRLGTLGPRLQFVRDIDVLESRDPTVM